METFFQKVSFLSLNHVFLEIATPVDFWKFKKFFCRILV